MISSGQICQFDDMHVKSVVLDEIMKDPENPREDFVFELEIKVGGGEWGVVRNRGRNYVE